MFKGPKNVFSRLKHLLEASKSILERLKHLLMAKQEDFIKQCHKKMPHRKTMRHLLML